MIEGVTAEEYRVVSDVFVETMKHWLSVEKDKKARKIMEDMIDAAEERAGQRLNK